MKKIILIRHGKSAWNYPELTDHERPLAERGLRDVPKMAARLKEKGIYPDLILSSTAVRAAHTAIIMAEGLAINPDKISYQDNLYHSSAGLLRKILQGQDDQHSLIFMVGHNPGMNELIWSLGGDIENLPTSGIFGFKIQAAHWLNFKPEHVEPWFFDYPKKAL
ncbi:histidine phosphatase family protein [Algoriphagus halophytocola]|uniref:Histidine phosphatase family protein n=1 Tax=Algoriphagus halophytocola TaxID=2991499 RepID=A0ABY6MN92_9BACT|nr:MULTISPECIES: histidine phosphatase family protein [unclassified Algoriphagus]UZD24479.1 histidine phosphatase family protein [Algoriphagus sp. TR-M5]WBL41843.1 histidine phosphatase family protein [Algoriphagus sp. TR-M9]